MESVNDSETMEDMITFGQWSLQSSPLGSEWVEVKRTIKCMKCYLKYLKKCK